jgi:hypothetical protein
MNAEFDKAWPLLEPAVVRLGLHTRASVLEAIENNRSRLWLLPNSAAVTSFWKYPSGIKSLQVWLAGGKLDEIVDWVHGPALDCAMAAKCDEMRLSGRRGWVRAFGWPEIATVSTIAIKDLRHDA